MPLPPPLTSATRSSIRPLPKLDPIFRSTVPVVKLRSGSVRRIGSSKLVFGRVVARPGREGITMASSAEVKEVTRERASTEADGGYTLMAHKVADHLRQAIFDGRLTAGSPVRQ